jgi:hypothetical protein
MYIQLRKKKLFYKFFKTKQMTASKKQNKNYMQVQIIDFFNE